MEPGANGARIGRRVRVPVHAKARVDEQGRDRCGQRLDRQTPDVLAVHPVQLLGVEHGVAAADPLEREVVNQLGR